MKDRFMKNGVFSLEYDKETLRDMVLELQEENKILRENAENNDKVVDNVNWENMLLKKENESLLYYKKIIDKIIIVKDYPSKEDSNYILCNMSKQELYKLLCETRERIYKGR